MHIRTARLRRKRTRRNGAQFSKRVQPSSPPARSTRPLPTGVSYGPFFPLPGVDSRWEGHAVGKIVPRASSALYAIHPGVLDAALQTLIGFAIGRRTPVKMMLPFALDRYVSTPCRRVLLRSRQHRAGRCPI